MTVLTLWNRRLRVVAAIIVAAGALPGAFAQASAPYLGRPIENVLRELRLGGLRIVYSSALVHSEMVVEVEPTAKDPRGILEEILQTHGLTARVATGGTIVIVRRREPAPPPSPEGKNDTTMSPATSPAETVFLGEVVVTPSHFRILEDLPEVHTVMTRTEVERMPHLADDLYRAVSRLPGTAGGDFSARFNVRGGEQGELLVLLDGAELYEPFHFKDFQNVFSVIDTAAVGEVDLLTGGYPVEYGDRMSGVMDISVSAPSDPSSTTLAVGTMNARAFSSGSFDGGRGSWVVSARAWYPEVLPKLVDLTTDWVETDYYDLFAKVEHTVGTRSTVSADLLMAFDDLGYRTEDDEGFEDVTARYASSQLWFNLRTSWTERLFSQTVLGGGRLTRRREGGMEDVELGSLVVNDWRTFDFVDLKQNWTFDPTDSHLLKWGFQLDRHEARYDYLRLETATGPNPPEPDRTAVDLEPDGWAYGVYFADRFRPINDLVVELGLRWDRQTWIGDDQLSPRLNLMYRCGPRSTLRAAWGRFHQSQRLNELQIEDGVDQFAEAQQAEHWLASFERAFDHGIGVRVELYSKELANLKPRYENQFSHIELFPEAMADRILVDPDRGRARGLEVMVARKNGRFVSWWVSYVLSAVEDRIDGTWQPRYWDQRHAVTFGLDLTLPRGWTLDLAGNWRTGWPTTEVGAELVELPGGEIEIAPVLGPRNAARYPDYHRLDLRATKGFAIGRGDLTLVVEILNVLNTRNVCCVDDFNYIINDDGSVDVVTDYRPWAPIIPSIGVRYSF